MFNGLRHVVRYGMPWRVVPHDLPPSGIDPTA
jgi:hypothetical protein